MTRKSTMRKAIGLLAMLGVTGVALAAQAGSYTWTTAGVPTHVNVVQGCGADEGKAFVWVYVPDSSYEFSFRLEGSGAAEMYESIKSAIANNKKIQLNYFGPDSSETPEYLNQNVHRYAKGNCNLEANRFVLVRSVALNTN
jgi:hypothetical protein